MDPQLITLVTQGGAFGLLVYIVIWMFPKHSERADAREDNLIKMFKDELQLEREHCDAKLKEVVEAFKDSVAKIERRLDADKQG
jgi:hypothetical protein